MTNPTSHNASTGLSRREALTALGAATATLVGTGAAQAQTLSPYADPAEPGLHTPTPARHLTPLPPAP